MRCDYQRLEYFENNFIADPRAFAVCGPQHHESTSKETARNFSRNMSDVWKKCPLSAHELRYIERYKLYT